MRGFAEVALLCILGQLAARWLRLRTGLRFRRVTLLSVGMGLGLLGWVLEVRGIAPVGPLILPTLMALATFDDNVIVLPPYWALWRWAWRWPTRVVVRNGTH
jgi:hypothetical protein